MKAGTSPEEDVALQHWPKQLRVLDDLLRCGICYEYMQNTVVTPCSHNFCSACIRTSLTFKNMCPSCQAELSDGHLHPNRIVDAVAEAYTPVRHMILSLPQQNQRGLPVKESCTEDTDVKSSLPVPGTSKETNSSAGSELVQTLQAAPLSSKVPCPVCSVEIKEVFINSHLDSCLKRASTSASLTQIKPGTMQGRKPLPKLVYSLLSEKDLRKKLKDLGLSTKGDKKTLEKRHQRYTILYNAEGDSSKPRSSAELVREIEREEAAERKQGGSFSGVLKTERNADEASNDQERRRYLQENSNQFRELVQRAKRDRENPVPDSDDSSSSEVVVLENVPKKEKIIEEAIIDDDDDDNPPESTSKDSLFTEGEDTMPYPPTDQRRDRTSQPHEDSPLENNTDSDATEPDPDLMNRTPLYDYDDPDPTPEKSRHSACQ